MAYELSLVCKAFGEVEVLKRIDLAFVEGTISVILGPSGCGKTTLLNIIAGLLPFDSGERRGFAGTRFSYAFQEPRLLPWLSARENAAFALSGVMGREMALARVDVLLKAAGLGDSGDKRPAELSGGMRQRLSIVRAFAFPAQVLLLDEAFIAVDLKTKIDLMDVFLDLWRREKPTVICVTHDVEEAVYLADRAIVLSPRPSTILDDFRIDTAREGRALGSEAAMEAEGRLYSLVMGKP